MFINSLYVKIIFIIIKFQSKTKSCNYVQDPKFHEQTMTIKYFKLKINILPKFHWQFFYIYTDIMVNIENSILIPKNNAESCACAAVHISMKIIDYIVFYNNEYGQSCFQKYWNTLFVFLNIKLMKKRWKVPKKQNI